MIHSTAMVDNSAKLGSGCQVWANSTIREGVHIGANTSIGIGAYVGPEVTIGSNCKIQNGAYLYEPCTLGNGVFIGPSVVFTNDRSPRAIKPTGDQISAGDWEPVGVTVNEGASIGAMAVCVAPITIGKWSMVAAGAVVIQDVPDFALVAGSPAKRIGWVGRAGQRLIRFNSGWVCPTNGDQFIEDEESGLLTLQDSKNNIFSQED
jgi:UDP-2-acetamido-3-amino-2,3-dideoxy-glucuronate N-acetyltransferase